MLLLRFLWVGTILSISGCVTNSVSHTSTNSPCLGASDAQTNAIYLHGLVGEAGETKKTQDFLISRAHDSQLRMAMPRAYLPCADNAPKDKYCWHWGPESPETLQQRLTDLRNRSRECFPNAKNVPVYIGFSNGAGFLNRLFLNCKFGKDDILISVGNGLHQWHKPQHEGNLGSCGRLHLIIGNKDHANQSQVQYAYEMLKARGADVTLHEYDGGHELNSNIPKFDALIARP